jgi:hypothetical protein
MYTTSDKFHSFGECEWTTVFDINNPCSKSKSTTTKPKTSNKKKKTDKSHSSTDKSITNDSDEEEPIDIKKKNDFAVGKCLISIKK